jgi:hypothetical protein
MVVTSGWVGDGLKGECLFQPWLGECGNDPWRMLCRTLPALAGFLVSALLTYHLAKGWLPVRHLAQNQTVRPHKVLIAPISLFNPLPECSGGTFRVKDAKSGNEVVFTGDLANDIEAFNKLGWRWNGQQFLRGLEPHVASGDLADLVLIGSSGKFASHAGLGVTKQMASLYSTANVHLHTEAINFEDIHTLQQVFDGWIKTFDDKGVPEREILLEATGGQKTTSIAAALTTLRWSQVEFQYVESKDVVVAGEKPNVISFNVVVEAPQKGLET